MSENVTLLYITILNLQLHTFLETLGTFNMTSIKRKTHTPSIDLYYFITKNNDISARSHCAIKRFMHHAIVIIIQYD